MTPNRTTIEKVEHLIAALREARDDTARAEARNALTQLAGGRDGSQVRDHIEQMMKGERLEVQWELEEVLEATAPKKPEPNPDPAPEPEPEPDPNRKLTASDLRLVYDDPRGLMLHKTRTGDRWFATQVDPRTGQPQTFELHPQEVAQLKAQLEGSPYWLLGG